MHFHLYVPQPILHIENAICVNIDNFTNSWKMLPNGKKLNKFINTITLCFLITG